MHLRVIEGGLGKLDDYGRRPISWDRLPIEGQKVALVRREADSPGREWLAYDDGRAFLIGCRTIHTRWDAHVLATWSACARAEGLQVRDERVSGA